MVSNNITPSAAAKRGVGSRERRYGRIEKTPKRGMGVARLELLRQHDLWTSHFASLNRPVHISPPVRNFPDYRTGRFGVGGRVVSTERSCCCYLCIKKKRLANYGIQQVPPVAGGYGQLCPNLNVEIGTQEEILTKYEFFPEKMIDRDRDRDDLVVITKLGGSNHDALPSFYGGYEASDHRSNTTIDLSLRL